VAHTQCARIDGRRLQYLDRLQPSCPDRRVLASVSLISIGCRAAYYRYMLSCVLVPAQMARKPRAFMATHCTSTRGQLLSALERHKLQCGPGAALAGFRLSGEGCFRRGTMRYIYECEIVGGRPPGSTRAAEQRSSIGNAGNTGSTDSAGSAGSAGSTGSTGDSVGMGHRDAISMHAGYTELTNGTACTKASRAFSEHLSLHAISCPQGHAVSGFHFTPEGCARQLYSTVGSTPSLSTPMMWVESYVQAHMHFSFRCVPLVMEDQDGRAARK